MKNQLKNESSPYLLQHADNPVSWYPWTEEAFDRARAEDKPIFLSIGYSTCHWCHVMAHESFENPEIAEILNEHFISIKVDREERPDIDSVYMSVCQAFTGRGGWPMSIFMTWDQKPFFAGTYFPLFSVNGLLGFHELLTATVTAWRKNRNDLLESATQITSLLNQSGSLHSATDDKKLIETAVKLFSDSFDEQYGGFGPAPKFPTAHNLLFLMLFSVIHDNKHTMAMVEKTLVQMRKGGIFDQIGHGFSRYSTDARFLVPHFEKMLYDNALLIMAYAAAYYISGKQIYLDTAEKTAGYILREMTHPEGGFYSAQDADSDGVEGKYYCFQPEEITKLLGAEAGSHFAEVYDISNKGNFQGSNIPNLLKWEKPIPDLEEEIQKLYRYRKQRFHLHLDDKILCAWNSLMIIALSMLSRVSGKQEYLDAACKGQQFIEQNLIADGKIYTSCRNGKHSAKGFLDDYAYYTSALIELYQATLDSNYLQKAEKFCQESLDLFEDKKRGGYYLCPIETAELITNPKESYDGAMPSGNSVMAYNLVRLFHITEKETYEIPAKEQLAFLAEQAADYPTDHSLFLIAKLLYENPPMHIKIVPKNGQIMREIACQIPFSADVFVVNESSEYPLLNGENTYYICQDHTCYPPSNEIKITHRNKH